MEDAVDELTKEVVDNLFCTRVSMEEGVFPGVPLQSGISHASKPDAIDRTHLPCMFEKGRSLAVMNCKGIDGNRQIER